jgi:hypothetical protein
MSLELVIPDLQIMFGLDGLFIIIYLEMKRNSSIAMFVWLISHQPAVLFSQNKPATSNQPTILFSQNKSAPAISHQPNEQADCWCCYCANSVNIQYTWDDSFNLQTLARLFVTSSRRRKLSRTWTSWSQSGRSATLVESGGQSRKDLGYFLCRIIS